MQENIFENKFLKLRHPFTCVIAGMTGAGKTILVRRLLKNWKCSIDLNEPINNNNNLNVLWVYGQDQELYKQKLENTNITYSEYLPKENDLKISNYKIIVIDDLMLELDKNENFSKLFTKLSHHLNISVVLIVQNFFHQSKHMRTISLNSQYIVLMKNLRDQNQIDLLGRQLFGQKWKSFRNIFDDATQRPYGYLLIDLKPDTPEKFRLKTRLTEEELPPSIQQKSKFSPIYYILHV
jgi:hypothetical protein